MMLLIEDPLVYPPARRTMYLREERSVKFAFWKLEPTQADVDEGDALIATSFRYSIV